QGNNDPRIAGLYRYRADRSSGGCAGHEIVHPIPTDDFGARGVSRHAPREESRQTTAGSRFKAGQLRERSAACCWGRRCGGRTRKEYRLHLLRIGMPGCASLN
ncbi:hypothetical protein TNCT_665381, partial [Trichonephila clavata]